MKSRETLAKVFMITFVAAIVLNIVNILVPAAAAWNPKAHPAVKQAKMGLVLNAFLNLALSTLFDFWILSICKSWVNEGHRLIKESQQPQQQFQQPQQQFQQPQPGI